MPHVIKTNVWRPDLGVSQNARTQKIGRA
jgi:hypothetical protein